MIINRYILAGLLLIAVGFILTPVIIGIPIMVLGFLVADFGLLVWVIKLIPGLEEKLQGIFLIIKKSYEPYFKKGVKGK